MDAVELDVHVLENELVVIHDDTLPRTTNGEGSIYETTLDELRLLDAGNGERIPLLREIFEILPESMGINVELKGAGTAVATSNLIEETGFDRNRLMISSFHLDEIVTFGCLQPNVRMGYLRTSFSTKVLNDAIRIKATSLNLIEKCVTPKYVQQIHAAGLRVLVFTVNDASDVERLHQWGVDGVFTDDPHLFTRA